MFDSSAIFFFYPATPGCFFRSVFIAFAALSSEQAASPSQINVLYREGFGERYPVCNNALDRRENLDISHATLYNGRYWSSIYYDIAKTDKPVISEEP
jgi:hypothetical protein